MRATRALRAMRALALALAAACGGSKPGTVPVELPASQPPQDLAEADDETLEDTVAGAPVTPIADAYREVATRIIADARADRGGWEKLAHLTDRIGHRLAGSPQLDQAIAWAADAMKQDGHDVRTEKVMVPHWVRGAEAARITAPIQRDLVVLALGGSVGTPKGGLAGRVVVVHDWNELEARKADVKGAIVLFNVAMPAWTEEHGSGYGDVVPYRWASASAAAKLGATAVLIRSVTAHSLRTPHTGSMGYAEDAPRIPAAAITIEDAQLIERLAGAGVVKLQLELGARMLPDVPSANVIGELRGREKPDEIVVIGGHLDSWDVGQGAHDDGAGCVHVMQALTVLRRLGLQPRRTIRVVLFTNEENGLRGGTGYAEAHAAEVGKHVAALETDAGGYRPIGLEVAAPEAKADEIAAKVADLLSLLAPIGATKVERSDHAGADIAPLTRQGVLGLGLRTDGRTYFDIHHTPADTLDKVDPAALADGIAAVAVVAFVLADLPDPIK
ncbi:MAG TPA: M20/M25/M40 family metallo-hydrolase [Kofleriaceae bacterium]|nr:M20/M25/M40 family metallo-hydrolase [Kofleriaceae bacterium]